jgi:serine/threonine protein kinase
LFERSTTPGTVYINGASGSCPPYIGQLVYNLALNLYLFHENLQRIHGDIKPENILLCRSDRRFKLVDYGSSVPFGSLRHYHEGFEIVSWLYRAPELLVGIPFGAGVDVWALGAVLFEACAKRPLSASLDRVERLEELSDLLGPYPDSYSQAKLVPAEFEIPSVASFDEQDPAWWRRWRAANLIPYVRYKDVQLVDLLSGMLDPDFNTRLTIAQVLDHPFLASFVPFQPSAKTLAVTGPENIKPVEQNGANDKQQKNSVDADIETVMLTMTPVKAPAKRGLGATRKVSSFTGKRKIRS